MALSRGFPFPTMRDQVELERAIPRAANRCGISVHIAQKCTLSARLINPMISAMDGAWVQIRVWIDCPACGRCQKLARKVILPFELITPMLERTCAVCERCQEIAVMCFQRSVARLH